MPTYFRVQPKGLGTDHDSESSAGSATGLDVFPRAFHLYRLDAPRKFYGDEVLVLEADRDWENGDVEGVRIDGKSARVLARMTWDEVDSKVRRALKLKADARPMPNSEDEDRIAEALRGAVAEDRVKRKLRGKAR